MLFRSLIFDLSLCPFFAIELCTSKPKPKTKVQRPKIKFRCTSNSTHAQHLVSWKAHVPAFQLPVRQLKNSGTMRFPGN